MHPQIHATSMPDKPAAIMVPGGETVTFRQLEARANQGAHFFRSKGFRQGDTIAICLENCLAFLDIVWAAQRSGLRYVCISSRLTAAEIEYIVRDSAARTLITSQKVDADVRALAASLSGIGLMMAGETIPPFEAWASAVRDLPQTPIADQCAGVEMLYSSGTTGRPKGIVVQPPADNAIDAPWMVDRLASAFFGMNSDSIYLCPAPLYHAAPLKWTMSAQKAGATVVVMDHFDPELALATIEKYRVNIAQFVPTHFVRLLKLPPEIRAKYDVSSLKMAIHAAAPCPIPVKEAMIDWWGPIFTEYYASTEAISFNLINSKEWLERKGSVGKSFVGTIRICDDDGEPLPARTEGTIYVEGGNPIAYHNDPEKTASALNRRGWATVGDIGWLDEDGYLYLTDRRSFMIISGGVNIYPQEVENLLTTHPRVMDAAVVGAPDTEMGERVVAVIQPIDWRDATEDFAAELTEWMRGQLSGIKIPRQIDFMKELPRHPTGKLYKRLLRDRYYGKG